MMLLMYQSIPRAPTPPPPNRATPQTFEFCKKKIVKSPTMWASYTIKCPTVRTQKNCQIPLPPENASCARK